MMSDTATQVRELSARWADAERRGEVDALEALVVPDFHLVGPLGFVLDREQWLRRFDDDGFVMSALGWDMVEVRVYGTTGVTIGRQTQQATYQGRPSDGQFRTTHIAVLTDDGWRLAGMHLTSIGAFRPPTGD
jgi:ketosteroid isomerase-like protein